MLLLSRYDTINPNVFPETHEVVDLTPLIARTLSFFLGICYLALEIPVLSLLSKNKSEALFSSFKHKINQATQKLWMMRLKSMIVI